MYFIFVWMLQLVKNSHKDMNNHLNFNRASICKPFSLDLIHASANIVPNLHEMVSTVSAPAGTAFDIEPGSTMGCALVALLDTSEWTSSGNADGVPDGTLLDIADGTAVVRFNGVDDGITLGWPLGKLLDTKFSRNYWANSRCGWMAIRMKV